MHTIDPRSKTRNLSLKSLIHLLQSLDLRHLLGKLFDLWWEGHPTRVKIGKQVTIYGYYVWTISNFENQKQSNANQLTNANFIANHDDAEIKMNQSNLKEKNVADAKRRKTVLSSNHSDFLGADSENSERGGRNT